MFSPIFFVKKYDIKTFHETQRKYMLGLDRGVNPDPENCVTFYKS